MGGDGLQAWRYASDLSDDQWRLIEPLTARPDPRGAKNKHSRRAVLNAVLYVVKTGCQWALLPKDFPPHQTVYDHFRRLSRRGVWERINRLANETSRRQEGRAAAPSYLLVDSQSVKTNYEGEARGFHGGKKVKGRSRQIAVDTGGRLWGVPIHAANQADTKAGCVLADRVLPGLPSVTALCADAGYRGTFVEHLQTRWQKAVHISTKLKDGFAVIPKRWVVERSFGWFNGQRRLSKDYEKKTAHAEAMLLIAAFTRTLRALAF